MHLVDLIPVPDGAVTWRHLLSLAVGSFHFCDELAHNFILAMFVHSRASVLLLDVHGLGGATEGRLSHFFPCWLRTGWQIVISQGQVLEIGESNPDHGENTPWKTFKWLSRWTMMASHFKWLALFSQESFSDKLTFIAHCPAANSMRHATTGGTARIYALEFSAPQRWQL